MFQSPFSPPVIGVPSWPVLAPLIAGLGERGDLKLTLLGEAPYARGAFDETYTCALVPPALVLDDPGLCVIPGAGLVANETGSRERLLSEEPLEAIRRIGFAPEAGILALYLRVIYAELGLPLPDLIPEGVATDCDAVLVSGVNARDAEGSGHDVAALWRECAGGPLVLGVWACRSSGPIRLLRQVLGESARRGEQEAPVADTSGYYVRVLSEESESIRTLHRLARHHAIAGANVESIGFC